MNNIDQKTLLNTNNDLENSNLENDNTYKLSDTCKSLSFEDTNKCSQIFDKYLK